MSPIVGSSLLGEYRASDELPGETLGDQPNFRIPRHPGSTAIGLVPPEETERTLNPSNLKAHRPLDGEAQFALVAESFSTNAYLIRIDNPPDGDSGRSVCRWPQTTVSFIKLTPPVGS